MRKKSKKKLKSLAWSEFSRYIRQKYADKSGYVQCVTCGTIAHWKNMHAGHFIPGRNNAVLFLEDCVHPQCYVCNIHKNGNLISYFIFMEKKYGRKRLDEIVVISNFPKKYTENDYAEMIERFKSLQKFV